MARPIDPESLLQKIRSVLLKFPSATSLEASRLLGVPLNKKFYGTFSVAKGQLVKSTIQSIIEKDVPAVVEIKPVQSKLLKIVAVADPHSTHVNRRAWNQAIAFIDDYKPDLLVHLGDNWDFASLRSAASPEERATSVLEDYKVGEELMRQLFEGRNCEKVFLWGNHDDRIPQGLHKLDGPKKDLCTMIYEKQTKLIKELGVFDVKFDASQGVFKKGPVSFIHGFYHCENTAKKHAEVYGTVLAGDMHSIQYWRLTRKERTEGFHIGCMCDKEPDYMARLAGKMRWEHGFAYGVIKDDFYEIHQAKMSTDGAFYLPQNIKAY